MTMLIAICTTIPWEPSTGDGREPGNLIEKSPESRVMGDFFTGTA
jgi:hypothetical protein